MILTRYLCNNCLIIFLFLKSSFNIAMSKHSWQLITSCHMNLTIVSILKLNNARVFIHSVRLFQTIIIVFIVFDANMCTQSILIFLKNVDIHVKCNVFFFLLNFLCWQTSQLATYLSQFLYKLRYQYLSVTRQ